VRAEVRQIARLDGASLERFAVDTGVVPEVSPSLGSLTQLAIENIDEDEHDRGDGGVAGDARQPRERASVRVARGILRAIEAQRANGRGAFSRLVEIEDVEDLDRAFVSLGFDPMKGAEE